VVLTVSKRRDYSYEYYVDYVSLDYHYLDSGALKMRG
jgi:hypothetical protein